MVFREPDECSSSPAPRRKARTRPPDVTEARSRAQRAKLDTQANERTAQATSSGASHEQTEHSSVQARRRAATTLARTIDDYLQDHEGGNSSRKTLEWHHTALGLLQTFLEEERGITLVAEVDASDISAWFAYLRLERLLCWRESPERWPCYQHMLPVLILATTPRQCEHWQCAVKSSALKLCHEPLAGALACPPPPGGDESPWGFSWRTLSTAMSCHLQDLLRPLPPAAFPSSLQLEEEEEPAARSFAHVAAVPAHFARLVVGELVTRTAHLSQDGPEDQEAIALFGLHLTPCQWNILRLLLAHPLLSDEELAAFLRLHRSSVRCSLYALHHVGCLEPIPTEAGKRWRLCERGLRLLAAANRMHIRNIAVQPDEEADGETAPVVQRGENWLVQRIHHTAGIYRFFASLAETAREQPEQCLCWWETGASCERHYRVGGHWYNLKPDALAEYRVGPRPLRFWLEWDCGTMNVRDLALKFTAYAHYLASREWARERSLLPQLVCIAPDLAQERRMHRVAQASLRQRPGIVIHTTTTAHLANLGLLASIWSQVVLPGDGPIASSRSLRTTRMSLFAQADAGRSVPQ